MLSLIQALFVSVGSQTSENTVIATLVQILAQGCWQVLQRIVLEDVAYT